MYTPRATGAMARIPFSPRRSSSACPPHTTSARTSALRPRPRRHGARRPTSRRSSSARPARLQQAAPATLLVTVPSPCGPSSLRPAQRALDSDDPEDARGWRIGGRGRRRDLTTGGSCAKPRRGGPLARGACHRRPSPRSLLWPRWPSFPRGSSAGGCAPPVGGRGRSRMSPAHPLPPPWATRRSSASRGRVVTGGG